MHCFTSRCRPIAGCRCYQVGEEFERAPKSNGQLLSSFRLSVCQIKTKYFALCHCTEFLFFRVFENKDGEYALLQYDAMIVLLDDFEKQLMESWKKNTVDKIPILLKKNLLHMDGTSLYENFDDEVCLRPSCKVHRMMSL